MKNLESNKLFASILLVGIAVLVVSNVVDILYRPKQVTEYGYAVDVSSSPSPTAGTSAFNIENVDIGTLLAKSNIANGEKISKKCIACHSFDKGGQNKVGPNLWGIVGNKKAHLGSQFNYSKGLLEMGGIWDYTSLLHFLYKPSTYIKGTKMSFAGLSKEDQLGDILLYLRSLSDSPLQLPEPKKQDQDQQKPANPNEESNVAQHTAAQDTVQKATNQDSNQDLKKIDGN